MVAATERCALTVCRGCCCGTDDVDGAQQWLDTLRDQLPGITVRVSRCLGPCDRRDVVVVGPSKAGRARGARAIWLSKMGSSRPLVALTDWVRTGGPGLAPLPSELSFHRFRWQRRPAAG